MMKVPCLLLLCLGVALVSGQCLIDKCTSCTSAKSCNSCYIGVPERMDYRGPIRLPLPKSGSCTDYNIANCTKYEMTDGNPIGTCMECVEGYVLSSDSAGCLKCSESDVIENCMTCAAAVDGYTCSACKHGYVLQDNACQTCPENCASCSVTGAGQIQCETCAEDYGLKPDKSACVSCEYEASPGWTKYCPSCTVDNAGNLVACTNCSSGFLDTGGKCQDCSSISDLCYRCEDTDADNVPDVCTECDQYQGIVSGGCSACSIKDSSTECHGCDGSDLDRCSQCYWHSWKRREFWVIRPDGSGCTKCMNKCEVCTDLDNDGTPENCIQCLNGTRYHLDDGQCEDCGDKQCAECAKTTTCDTCDGEYKVADDGLSCGSESNDSSEATVMTYTASFLLSTVIATVSALNSRLLFG